MKKLTALIFSLSALSATADVVIPDSDNFVISTQSARLAATGFGVTKDKDVIFYHVYDCQKGTGDIDVHVAYSRKNDQGLTHLTTTRWIASGKSTMNRAATYICATALAKDGKL